MSRRRDDQTPPHTGSSWRSRREFQGRGRQDAATAAAPASVEEAVAGADGDCATEAGTESSRRECAQPASTAYGKALGLLSRREHSQRELRRKLERSGFDGSESVQALEQLQQQSFQSDARFAELLVRSRISQGQGPRRIRAELRTHSIGDEEAQQALDQAGEDWLALARRVYRRRFGTAASADRQESHRRAGFLLRRGFDAATVRAITHADDVDDSAEEFD